MDKVAFIDLEASGLGAGRTLDVVLVLVGHQDTAEGSRIDLDAIQALFKLTRGKTTIEQQPGIGRLNQRGIAAATTPK